MRYRRFAAVSTVVTIVDVAALGAGRAAGLHVALADTVAVGVASLLSFALHRAFTLTDDPFVRWVRQPVTFLVTATAAGAVDVLVTTSLNRGLALAVAKLMALALAGGFRATAYRMVLLVDTRRDLRTRRDRPPSPGERRLTVVLPAFCEEERVADSVARVREALDDLDVEILVVDDGSTDATAARAAEAGARVVRLEHNRGKGAAVRAGMLAAAGRTVAFTDVDLAYAPEQLRALVAAVEDGWDVAVGNRWHAASAAVARPSIVRRASSRLFNLLTIAVLLGQYRDTQCGCKAFRSDVARVVFGRTRIDGFAFDVEVLHLVERYRLSLTEVPVQVSDGGPSTVRVAAAAAGMVRDLFRVRRWGSEGAYELTASEVAASGWAEPAERNGQQG
jgi:dolichyl-phosphate beta-glucosyltransferase